jgi:hypothetical protein
MSESSSWRVYGGPPPARTLTSERAARKLMREYERLGIQASLYSGDGDGDDWVLSERRDASGQPYRLPDDAPDDISGIGTHG